MGQYEPEDSRDVTLNDGHEPGGIKRTGPREDESRQQEQQQQQGCLLYTSPSPRDRG